MTSCYSPPLHSLCSSYIAISLLLPTGLCIGCSLHRNVLPQSICTAYSSSYFGSLQMSPFLTTLFKSELAPHNLALPSPLVGCLLFFSTTFAFVYHIYYIFIIYLPLIDANSMHLGTFVQLTFEQHGG